MVIKIATATVKFAAGKVFNTQYGERINALVVLPNGEEVKLWGSPSDSRLLALKKGESVQLADAGKGWKLMVPNEEEATTLAPSPSNGTKQSMVPAEAQRWTQEDIDQFMGLVEDYAAAMGFCLQTANKYRADGLVQTEESVRMLATTLFVAATRALKK